MMPTPYPTTKAARAAALGADRGALSSRLDDLEGPLRNGVDKAALVAYAKRQGILPH